MFRRFHYNAPHYFVMRLHVELKELVVSFALMELAVNAVMLFEPIFLYTLGYDLQEIMLFYALVYGLYLVLLPFGGQLTAWLGNERTILLSAFPYIGYFAALFALPALPSLFWIAPVLFALQKALYWPAYHADFARYSDRLQRGKEVSSMLTLGTFLATLGPFLGGTVVALSGFQSLFAIVIILILISNIPLFLTKHAMRKRRVSPGYFWRFLSAPQTRRRLVAYAGFGEELVVLVVWPIMIFLAVRNAFAFGSVIAVAGILTALVTLYIGKLSDRLRRARIIRVGVLFTILAWLWRLVARSAWQLLPLDFLSRVSKNLVVVPLLAKTYDTANREDSLRYAVFFEQSLAIGKLLVTLVIFFLAPLVSGFTVAFLVAAAMSLLYLLV